MMKIKLFALLLGMAIMVFSCNKSEDINVPGPNDKPNNEKPEGEKPEDEKPENEKPNDEISDVISQAKYYREDMGGPARPSWVDIFRNYPETEFFKKGRYVLLWMKDPGLPGPEQNYNPALRWELYRINFNDPGAMRDESKFGMPINASDVEGFDVIASNKANAPITSTNVISLPTDLLPGIGNPGYPSSEQSPIEINPAINSQYGYVPVNATAMAAVVAYKVRLFRTIADVNDKGEPIELEVYNDSQVIFVDWRNGKTKIVTQSSGGDGGGNDGGTVEPDELTSIEDVRRELSLPADAYFKKDWEDKKVTGDAPIEKLMTKDDFNKLFPEKIRKDGHDKDATYYTWENLVKASKYFPKFLNEGTKEDKYRELAAFFGNKSHETGDGWASLGEARWSYGLFWIVELAAFGGSNSNPANKEDLYKAYSGNYTAPGHSDYPAVKGKSYHGRGPVQLSWNYNYGQMSEVLFGNKNILLSNPNLIARDGVLGWASAIWFWMEPQGNKPSCHDAMVGNVDLTEPYNPPTKQNDPNYGSRTHTQHSKGSRADGTSVSYDKLMVPRGLEVGFGLTINIINGGLECNVSKIDNRQARRIGYYARYLDYFGTDKGGRNDNKKEPISPAVSNNNGMGGDPVPQDAVDAMKTWRTWSRLPADGTENDFPADKIPSILSGIFQASLN